MTAQAISDQLDVIYRQVVDLNPLPLLMATVLAGLIGLEREVHGRPAGLRTHILVCLASTVLIYVSRNLTNPQTPGTVVFDPTRLAAGIVTGIGFLGAASVIRSGDMVRGVTTGACIWTVAALGVVIGYEQYGIAVATTVVVLLVLVGLDWVESWIAPLLYRQLAVRGHTKQVNVLAGKVRETLRQHRMRVQELTGSVVEDEGFELVFHIRCRSSLSAPQVLDAVTTVEGVERVEWV